MSETIGKTRNESRTVMTELVIPNDTNILGNLLGGRLLHWIDIAGALSAQRHTESLVATVKMNEVEFKRPVKLGNIVILTSYVTWTGNTSLEVAVETVMEDPLTRERYFINKVYVVFVALDADGKKHKVIPYLPKTDEETAEYNAAAERNRK